MATYVVPQALVFQDLQRQPVTAANPQSAHISGGHAQLVRFTDSAEKSLGSLGRYNNATDTTYAWPSLAAGAVIDASYTRVFVENALLRYFNDPLSAGSATQVVANYANRVRSPAVNFAASGAYSRDANLYDRDVAIGDVVRVRGTPTGPGNSGEPVTLWTYVKGLVADQLAAIISAPSIDAANAVTQSAAAAVSQTAGAENCVTVTADGAAYAGAAAGFISETYVVTVIDSSVSGDFTSARLRVSSASGTDDQAEVIPSAAGTATAIGTRGLEITFDLAASAACSLSATNEEVSPDDLIAGQEFTVTVSQAFTATTATSGGTYSAVNDTTYVVTVTKGGIFADNPEISVTTVNGIDQSGPHVVSGTAIAIPLGTKGVTLTFGASAALNKGDRFYIPVQGISEGPLRTLVLGQNLDEHYAAGDEVSLELYIRKSALELTANRTNMAPLTNWEQTATELTLRSGAVVYDATWTDGGLPLPLELHSSEVLNYGVVHAHYRAWLPTLVGTINSVTDISELDAISGPLTPDNPLKQGVADALTNSNGTPVLYTAVSDPSDTNAWLTVLDQLLTRDDCYGLVPLTRDPAVLALFQAHVNSASSASEKRWRTLWVNLSGLPEIPVVSNGSSVPNHTSATTADGELALAVFEDDPQTSGTQYTICRVPAANSNFITNGVRAGDIVRGLYTGDGFGNFTYTEFVIAEVQSENQLRVVAGPIAPQAIPAKIEVWRNLTASEEAVEIGQVAGSYGSRRVRATWPDVIDSAGTTKEGWFLNAALAGLASGVLPQQGLTNVELAGFSSVPRTSKKFNKPQLDAMAARGVWIVQQDNSGNIFSRHAVTTGNSADVDQREEMLTRNLDSISYRVADYLAPFIGVTNVTPTMRDIILGGLNKLLRSLQEARATPQLGGQLVSAEVDRFEVSPVFKDRYVVYVTAQLPYALNTVELHLVV